MNRNDCYSSVGVFENDVTAPLPCGLEAYFVQKLDDSSSRYGLKLT